MKKIYSVPFVRIIDLYEEGVIAVSDGATYELGNEEGEEQLTNKQNMWDREGIWK